jgi:hypothetical protein
MKLWVARDPDFTEKDGSKLNLFINKPIFDNEFNEWCSEDSFSIDERLFPEIIYENSPQEIEINLINHDSK